MADRSDLHDILVTLVSPNNVYFQPPPTFQIEYPCIVYERVDMSTRFADNFPYSIGMVYKLTWIDRDPDSSIPLAIAGLPQCIYDRHYVNGNLYHDVFELSF